MAFNRQSSITDDHSLPTRFFLRLLWLGFLLIPDHRLEKCCVHASRHRVRAAKRLPSCANGLQDHIIELGFFRFKRANGLIVYNFGRHILILAEESCPGEVLPGRGNGSRSGRFGCFEVAGATLDAIANKSQKKLCRVLGGIWRITE